MRGQEDPERPCERSLMSQVNRITHRPKPSQTAQASCIGYLNARGLTKDIATMGGDERLVYILDKRIQPQHIVITSPP